AYARNRIVRIVSVAVRLGIARGGIPRKYAIAAVAVGSAAALEIHSPVLCPGQRIFLFLPPYVPANHVQGNRRFILNAAVHVVEPIIEPAKLHGVRVDIGLRSEVQVTDFLGWAMSPG